MNGRPTTKHLMLIVGELPLVTELAGVCDARGIRQMCRVTTNPGVSLPRMLRHQPRSFAGISAAWEVTNIDLEQKKKNLRWLDRALGKSSPIFTSSITITATAQAEKLRHPERIIGISALPTLLSQQLIELSPTVFTGEEYLAKAKTYADLLGKQIAVIEDRVGMVMPRILGQLINEAFFAFAEGIGNPQDIDMAMKLGTAYPRGPLEWADAVGLDQVVAVLEALHNEFQEERYRVAPLLRSMARTGPWWQSKARPRKVTKT